MHCVARAADPVDVVNYRGMASSGLRTGSCGVSLRTSLAERKNPSVESIGGVPSASAGGSLERSADHRLRSAPQCAEGLWGLGSDTKIGSTFSPRAYVGYPEAAPPPPARRPLLRFACRNAPPVRRRGIPLGELRAAPALPVALGHGRRAGLESRGRRCPVPPVGPSAAPVCAESARGRTAVPRTGYWAEGEDLVAGMRGAFTRRTRENTYAIPPPPRIHYPSCPMWET